jgi:hypothetical protein
MRAQRKKIFIEGVSVSATALRESRDSIPNCTNRVARAALSTG